MKRTHVLLAGCGGILLMGMGLMTTSAQVLGNIKNVVQTIQNVVISDNPADPNSVVMDINTSGSSFSHPNPDAGVHDMIYVKPGSFQGSPIVMEDISFDIPLLPNVSCDSGQALVGVEVSDGVPKGICVDLFEGYRKPTTPDHHNGTIYYPRKVAINSAKNGSSVSEQDFGSVSLPRGVSTPVKFLVVNKSSDTDVSRGDSPAHMSVVGDVTVGSNASSIVLSPSDDVFSVRSPGNTVAFVSHNDKPLVMGGMGGADNVNQSLSIHNPVHSRDLSLVSNEKRTIIDAQTNKVSITPYDNILYMGKDSRPSIDARASLSHPLGRLMSYAYADIPAYHTRIFVGSPSTDIPAASSLDTTLTTDGIVSARGLSDRAGIAFSTFTNSDPAANLEDYGCKVLSVDQNGRVVLKQVPAEQCAEVQPLDYDYYECKTDGDRGSESGGPGCPSDHSIYNGSNQYSPGDDVCVPEGDPMPSAASCIADEEYLWVCVEPTEGSCSGTYAVISDGQCVGAGYQFNDDPGYGCNGPCGMCADYPCDILSESECKNPSIIDDGYGELCGSFQCSWQDTTSTTMSCASISENQCGVGDYSSCDRIEGSGSVVCQDENGNIVDESECATLTDVPDCGGDGDSGSSTLTVVSNFDWCNPSNHYEGEEGEVVISGEPNAYVNYEGSFFEGHGHTGYAFIRHNGSNLTSGPLQSGTIRLDSSGQAVVEMAACGGPCSNSSNPNNGDSNASLNIEYGGRNYSVNISGQGSCVSSP